MGTRASRAILLIISTVVIWYTILFRQNRTDRPNGLNTGKKMIYKASERFYTYTYKTVHLLKKCLPEGV